MADNNKVECVFRDRDGREIKVTGDINDSNFINLCKKRTGSEPYYFSGYTQPYYPLYYYYYPQGYYYYPAYGYRYYYPWYSGGWRSRRWSF